MVYRLFLILLIAPVELRALLGSKPINGRWRPANVPFGKPRRLSHPARGLRMSRNQKQTIAVVGCGAVGSYYGARLWEAGTYDVKFHMRGENYRASTASGLNVTSVHGDIFIPSDAIKAYETTDEIGPVDWVVVALKSSSLDIIPELIFPLLHEGTRVVVIMNGLIEQDLVAAINEYAGATVADEDVVTCCAALYGGMALICSNRLEPGRVDHSYAGILSGGLAASSSNGAAAEHRAAFESLWEPTKVEISFEDSLRRGRWKKCVWNLPYNGLSVAMGGVTVDVIVNDPSLRQLADIIMDETVAAANADLAAHGEDSSMFLGDAEKHMMRNLSDNMGQYKTSTMLDLTQRKPMEVKYLFRKPIEKAQRLDVPVPHLETVVAQIEATQRMYNLF